MRSGLLPAALLAASIGCTSKPSPAGGSPSASSGPVVVSGAVPEPPRNDDIQPVYPVDAGAPDPLAQRFCEAVQHLPQRRREECCPGSANGIAPVADCVRTLSFALHHGAVTLAETDVAACEKALAELLASCDAALSLRAMPSACDAIVKGTLAEAAACRSSVECIGGLRCRGLSAVSMGTCMQPGPAGQACNVAVDALAGFTRQDGFDGMHPECAGYCLHRRCEPPLAEGAACASDAMCPRGERCASRRCTSAPLPVVAQPCEAACAAGAVCIKGQCAALRVEGARCDVDAECLGRCERADAGAGNGTCVRACPRPLPPHLSPVPPAKRPRPSVH